MFSSRWSDGYSAGLGGHSWTFSDDPNFEAGLREGYNEYQRRKAEDERDEKRREYEEKENERRQNENERRESERREYEEEREKRRKLENAVESRSSHDEEYDEDEEGDDNDDDDQSSKSDNSDLLKRIAVLEMEISRLKAQGSTYCAKKEKAQQPKDEINKSSIDNQELSTPRKPSFIIEDGGRRLPESSYIPIDKLRTPISKEPNKEFLRAAELAEARYKTAIINGNTKDAQMYKKQAQFYKQKAYE